MPLKSVRSNDPDFLREYHDGGTPQPRETEIKTAAAKAKLAAVSSLSAHSGAADFDKALKAIQADALERGDLTGAIIVAQFLPNQPGKA
jgi:hypothetical protein